MEREGAAGERERAGEEGKGTIIDEEVNAKVKAMQTRIVRELKQLVKNQKLGNR